MMTHGRISGTRLFQMVFIASVLIFILMRLFLYGATVDAEADLVPLASLG